MSKNLSIRRLSFLLLKHLVATDFGNLSLDKVFELIMEGENLRNLKKEKEKYSISTTRTPHQHHTHCRSALELCREFFRSFSSMLHPVRQLVLRQVVNKL